VIRLSGTVVYLDGRAEDFSGGPRQWVAWEHYALSKGLPTAASDPQHAAALTMTWFLSWACATSKATPRPGFETWLDTIAEVSGFELEDVPPTLPAPSAERSSSSHSPPTDPLQSSTLPILPSSQP
jgi:hypothetical protein